MNTKRERRMRMRKGEIERKRGNAMELATWHLPLGAVRHLRRFLAPPLLALGLWLGRLLQILAQLDPVRGLVQSLPVDSGNARREIRGRSLASLRERRRLVS